MNMRWERYEKVNLFLIFFFGASLFSYFLLNGGAFWKNIRYDLFLNSPWASADLREERIVEVVVAEGQSVGVAAAAGPLTLVIPKIEIEAPVIPAREATNASVLAALEEGVGLYPESRRPGEDGRAVILGHSSRASWYRGDYAYVFSLLPRLEEGDEFFITGGGKKYVYRVFSTKILTKDETNRLLAGPANGSEVALITCYPIGSASKRNLVQAQLVSVENI
jgi:LPXTG-site transpeptidase (sortase) family protein